MIKQLLWLYMVVYASALPLGDSKRDTPPAKADNKKNLKDAKLPLPFSSSPKLFGDEKNENIMQNNADMTLGDNNDDEDEKYYNDEDEPQEESVKSRPEINAATAGTTNTAEIKEETYVEKCGCVPKIAPQVINDNNDTVPCNDTCGSCNNDTCTSRSEGADNAPDASEDAEGDTEEDAEDDPEDEDAPDEEEDGAVHEDAGKFTCHTCSTPVEHHHHHHHHPVTTTGGNAVTENQGTDTGVHTKFHRHEHDHFHHESPQMITCLHDHHHHHHHHHQHHHFHYQPYACKCDGKVMARHKSMDMSKVNSESPNELGSEVTDDANVISGDGEMMLVGPERPEWAPPPPNAENCKSRSPDEDSDLPFEHVDADDTSSSNKTQKSGNDTTKALINDAAKANVTQLVFSSVARICDFLHNKTNSYKVVHDDSAKRCCICRASKNQDGKGVKSAQNRCECHEHHCHNHCHNHCGNNCGDHCNNDHCSSPCSPSAHHYDSHRHAPCGCNDAPCGCSKAPCGCNTAPCACNDAPCSCNDTPCGCNDKPCACDKAPCGCDKAPCGCNDAPCGCNKAPCGCNNTPCGCNDQHVHHHHHHNHYDNHNCGKPCCNKPCCCGCHNRNNIKKKGHKKN